MDCPIDDSFEGTFLLASYNPSTVEQAVQRIMVPPGDYKVELFDSASGQWKETKSTILCSNYEVNTAKPRQYETCTLYMDAMSAPSSQTVMQVTRSASGSRFHTQIIMDDECI